MAEKSILVILGSGLYDLYKNERSKLLSLTTKYGPASVAEIKRAGSTRFLVMLRHGEDHALPPHLINYRANIQAAKDLGVDYIIASASVGAINPKLSVGQYVIVDQFLDFTRRRESTFYMESGAQFSHTDMTHPYSDRVRRALINAAKKYGDKLSLSGTYACTEGPRFETPAEIRMFRLLGGDVVGMTGVPEVVLANEAAIEYGTLAQVTNMAAGLQKKITQSEVGEIMKKSLMKTRKIIDAAAEGLAK